MIIKNFKTLKRKLSNINVGIRNDLMNSDKGEEGQNQEKTVEAGHLITLLQVIKL